MQTRVAIDPSAVSKRQLLYRNWKTTLHSIVWKNYNFHDYDTLSALSLLSLLLSLLVDLWCQWVLATKTRDYWKHLNSTSFFVIQFYREKGHLARWWIVRSWWKRSEACRNFIRTYRVNSTKHFEKNIHTFLRISGPHISETVLNARSTLSLLTFTYIYE